MRHGEVEHEITAPSCVLQVVEDLNVATLLPILIYTIYMFITGGPGTKLCAGEGGKVKDMC